MFTARISVPNDGVPVLVPVTDTGAYGKTLGLYNASTEDLELCGSEVTADESFRGLLSKSVIFLDLDPQEQVYVVNNGAAAAEVDAMGVR